MISIMIALHDAPTWQEADSRAKETLLAPSDLALYYREQMVADLMLRELVEEAPSEEVRAATAQYTQMLIDHESPQAATILAALNHLGDTWSQEQRAEAASAAAAAAQRRLLRDADCGGCSMEDAVFDPQQGPHFQATTRAIERLNEIARS
jgi:hypothetical protein